MRARRIELGLEQIPVATQVGVHQATWSNWETGLKLPSDRYRPRIAATLQIDVAELFAYPANGDTEAA